MHDDWYNNNKVVVQSYDDRYNITIILVRRYEDWYNRGRLKLSTG